MAKAQGKRTRSQRGDAAPKRGRPRSRRLLLPALALGVVVVLYYRPLASYVETRNELSARRAEVASLRAEKVRLELRLERTTSLVALEREARQVGLVRPGEQLFIVKGIAAWRRSHAGTLSGDGRP